MMLVYYKSRTKTGVCLTYVGGCGWRVGFVAQAIGLFSRRRRFQRRLVVRERETTKGRGLYIIVETITEEFEKFCLIVRKLVA